MPEPSAFEVELAIVKLKSHKSPGIDQIPAELIKAGGRTIRCAIHKLIISIWNKEVNIIIIISSSIQPLGQFGKKPEPSEATGMALVCCVLGKFLGVVCHCFPPRLDVPTFATRCLHIRNDARDPSSERWNYGRERLSSHIFYIRQILEKKWEYNEAVH